MEPKDLSVDRRNLLTLAGCGVAAVLAGETAAEAQIPGGPFPPGVFAPPNLQGEWTNLANNGPCGVFQAGGVLMMVNENGDMATARLQGNRLTVLQGWNVLNLFGNIVGNGQAILFSNGSQWRRA